MEVEMELECGHNAKSMVNSNSLQVNWSSFVPGIFGGSIENSDIVNASGKFETHILGPAIASFGTSVSNYKRDDVAMLSSRIQYDSKKPPVAVWSCVYDASGIPGVVPYDGGITVFDVAILLFLTKTHYSYCVIKLNAAGKSAVQIPKKISEEVRYNQGDEKQNYGIQLGFFTVVWTESMKRK